MNNSIRETKENHSNMDLSLRNIKLVQLYFIVIHRKPKNVPSLRI